MRTRQLDILLAPLKRTSLPSYQSKAYPFDTPAENALIENLMLSKKNYRQMALLQKNLQQRSIQLPKKS